MDLEDLVELDFNDTLVPPPFELQEENEDNLLDDLIAELQGIDLDEDL